MRANPAVIIPTVICMWQVSEICHAGEGRRRADGCDMFRAACLLLPICPYGRPVPRPCEKAGAKNESVDAVRVVIYVDVCGRAALEGLSDQDRDRLFNNYGVFQQTTFRREMPQRNIRGQVMQARDAPKACLFDQNTNTEPEAPPCPTTVRCATSHQRTSVWRIGATPDTKHAGTRSASTRSPP